MQTTGKLRYYDATQPGGSTAVAGKNAAHSEFLRTGRISRSKQFWAPDERRYLSHAEVSERTGRKLETAGERTHERMNAFHRSIQFPKVIFHRTLDGRPHLGYCHVTAASTHFAKGSRISWSFYIANFMSDIGEDERFFERINSNYARMYFAVAIEGEPGKALHINRNFRGNGLLFRTSDPNEAMRNVLMLGAPDSKVREILKKL